MCGFVLDISGVIYWWWGEGQCWKLSVVCGVNLTPVEPVGRVVVVGWSGVTL